MSTYPSITQGNQIEPHDLKDVRLIGDYQEIDVRMLREGPSVHAGHVAIALEDGVRVLLEPVWEPLALRPAAERKRFAGVRVAVVGLLFAEAPPDLHHPQTANLLMPCISDIRSIEMI